MQYKKLLRAKKGAGLSAAVYVRSNEPIALNSENRPVINAKTKSAQRTKVSFIKLQNNHVNTKSTEIKNYLKCAQKRSNEIKNEHKRTPPGGGAFANVIMYYIVSFAFACILYGVLAILLAYGNPQTILLGIGLILLGIIILGFGAMSSVGRY